MPWRIVDYTSIHEDLEQQLVLNRESNITYRSFYKTIEIANQMLQHYSGEFIIPEEFKFQKQEKASLLEVGHICRRFKIPGTDIDCKIYIVTVKAYKPPVPPVEDRRRSERVRPPVNYAEDNFNYERWNRRFEEEDGEEEEDEEYVEFVEEVIPPAFIQQFNNLNIALPAEPQVARRDDIVPRFLLGEFY